MLELDEQLDSGFRIDGKVIRQVNRDLTPGQAGGGLKRVRINVLETRKTPEGRILPLDLSSTIWMLSGGSRWSKRRAATSYGLMATICPAGAA